MGVLDDAIREHLELKRRHGAAEEDVRRQADEALGPARREVAPAETDEDTASAQEQPAELEGHQEAPAAEVSETGVEDAPLGEVEQPPQRAALDEEATLHRILDEEAERADQGSPTDADGLREPRFLRGETAVEEETALHDAGVLDEDPAPTDLAGETGAYDVEAEFEEEDEPFAGPGAEHDEPALEERHDAEPVQAGDTPPQGFTALDEEDLVDEDETGDGDVLEDTPDFLQETPEHDRLWFEQKPPRDFDFD
jgi:hypothetical protein